MSTDPIRQAATSMADQCRRLLDAVGAGELDAPAETRLRLEGALIALEALIGEPSSVLTKLGLDSK